MIRFLWRASRGYRLRPWASPYLRWRIETVSGMAAEEISPREFWIYMWQNRVDVVRFLRWVERMNHL